MLKNLVNGLLVAYVIDAADGLQYLQEGEWGKPESSHTGFAVFRERPLKASLILLEIYG